MIFTFVNEYSASRTRLMRSADDSSLAGLATDVYQYVFANGTPVAHILLRDYARGVIEVALHRGRKLPIDERLIKPPYGSKWPSTIPAEGELKDRYGAATATADKEDFTGSKLHPALRPV